MDLIQNFYNSESEEEGTEPVPEAPLPVQEEPEPVPEQNDEEKKKKKKKFSKTLKCYPKRPTDIWECIHCNNYYNRRSVNRHTKQAHPDKDKFKWHYNVKEIKHLEPNLKRIRWTDPSRSSIEVTVVWGRTKPMKTFPLGDLIGSHQVRADLKRIQEGPECGEKGIANSQLLTDMESVWRTAKNENGQYGEKISQCCVCLEESSAVNKSVIFHIGDVKNSMHVICTECIKRAWDGKNSGKCPLCTQLGQAIRIYHKK